MCLTWASTAASSTTCGWPRSCPFRENRNICRLSLRYGQYHLSVPYDEKLQPRRENQARVVALDPGVRSFLTWYCADSVGKIGEGSFFRIQRLCERLDKLLSRAAKSPSRKRRNMRRAANRIRLKDREPGCRSFTSRQRGFW